jgi:hypothetical protein
VAAASGDRPIQNDFGGSPNDLNDFYRALCKKLSFFTIETAKADAPIHDNLGALRVAGPSAAGCTSGKPSAWVIACLIAHWLSKRFGQQFIIENRFGQICAHRRSACRYWTGRVVLRENRAPGRRFTETK